MTKQQASKWLCHSSIGMSVSSGIPHSHVQMHVLSHTSSNGYHKEPISWVSPHMLFVSANSIDDHIDVKLCTKTEDSVHGVYKDLTGTMDAACWI